MGMSGKRSRSGIGQGHRPPAAEQVDLHQVGPAAQQALAPGEVLFAVGPVRLFDGLRSSMTAGGPGVFKHRRRPLDLRAIPSPQGTHEQANTTAYLLTHSNRANATIQDNPGPSHAWSRDRPSPLLPSTPPIARVRTLSRRSNWGRSGPVGQSPMRLAHRMGRKGPETAE
jgi:hypothetical protein